MFDWHYSNDIAREEHPTKGVFIASNIAWTGHSYFYGCAYMYKRKWPVLRHNPVLLLVNYIFIWYGLFLLMLYKYIEIVVHNCFTCCSRK